MGFVSRAIRSHGSRLALPLWVLMGLAVRVWAQPTAPDEAPKVFSLLNLVKSQAPASVAIGSEPVGIGQMPYGFYTGPVSWYPEVPVTIAVEGMKTGEIRPGTGAGPRRCPLYIAYDVTEKSVDGQPPVKKIEVVEIPGPSSRPRIAIDAINLTPAESLQINIGKNTVPLPRLKRVRLSTEAPLSGRVAPDGVEFGFGAPEDGGGLAALIVFFENESGELGYVVATGS